jgi:hypothetical protein
MQKSGEEEYTREMETQPRTLTREGLIELAAVIKRGLAPSDKVFYEVYSLTLPDGRKVAADGLDELFLENEFKHMPREMHVWVAGVNKGKLNRIEIHFTPVSLFLKVRGHDKAWVQAEYQQIAPLISELRMVSSEEVFGAGSISN